MSTRTDRDAVDWSDDVGDVASMARTDRAARLKHAMDRRGVISNNELDRQAKVGGGWTSRFLGSKKGRPGPDTLHKVCAALGIREEWLLYGTGQRDADPNEAVDPSPAPLGVDSGAPLSKAPRRGAGPALSFHPDINAVVRIARNRKQWSLPVLALADEMIRENPIAPEELEALLDRLQNELQRVKSAHMKPG